MSHSQKYTLFLKDVFLIAISGFGGNPAHIAMMIDIMAVKRKYISEEEIIEVFALTQVLPGPTSSQTITAIGHKLGGPRLAVIALIIFILPAVTIMTVAGVSINWLLENNFSLSFTRFVQPMAVGFVAFAAYRIARKVINSLLAVLLMLASIFLSLFFQSPYIFPLILLGSGFITGLKYKLHPEDETKKKLHIKWFYFLMWAGTFIVLAILTGIFDFLPISLFENFYRNGSLIFGGGQVLIPLLHTEFVEFKHALTSQEFLTGYGMAQAIPGPGFAFCSYMGVLSSREAGIPGEIVGGLVSAAGVFLPGTFLIFFIVNFWDDLKKYRIIRASLEGIHASSSGMVIAAAIMLMGTLDLGFQQNIEPSLTNWIIIIGTMLILASKKVAPPLLIFFGLLAGIIL
ncbi:chromate efflux transporter [Xanthovirga aplysinae]|uniref:chromate efflux transporter n=1 Tax=Xanthovirga aplysinae TaxID=2529853 RepID=UPI0012BCC11B|nr:chromate efflux transporter [Xanthovirga aplysinae]MTI31649.1 chromate efflux transporter [Xanthovirga aplysinae]